MMCFVWLSGQTGNISVCGIKWLICVTEVERVYCAVRTEYVNKIGVLIFKGLKI